MRCVEKTTKVGWENQKQNLPGLSILLRTGTEQISPLSSPWLNDHSLSTFDIHIHEIWWHLKLILQALFGDKMFYPHTFFDQFIATKVCNRKLFRHLCSNFLFTLSGFDPKNLNMVCVSSRIQKSNYFVAQRRGECVLNCVKATSQGLLFVSWFEIICWWLPLKLGGGRRFHLL